MDKLFSHGNTLHLVIHGKVQGVFFRDSMKREAFRLSICGWVRNKPDGTVEAMVQGEKNSLELIVQWAHRGPEHARIERVEIDQGEGRFNGFEILR